MSLSFQVIFNPAWFPKVRSTQPGNLIVHTSRIFNPPTDLDVFNNERRI